MVKKCKHLIRNIIGLVLATACTVALTACNGGNKSDGVLTSAIIQTEDNNWVVSEYRYNIGRKIYTMRMPFYTTSYYDYCDYNVCNYLGEEANMYVFQFGAYAYTGHIDTGSGSGSNVDDIDVIECSDALERTEWLVERTLVRIYSQNEDIFGVSFDNEGNEILPVVDISYSDINKIDNDDITMYSVKATENDKNYIGYWIYDNSKYSTLILFDNGVLAEKVINTLVVN